LVVNGSLKIGPGTAEVLKQYVGIHVNGNATYPESLSGCLTMMQVNGSSICYPDDAIVLKRSAVIDRMFALRAKNKLYWSAKKMIMVDPQLDSAVLVSKGATFSSSEVILAESKVESLIDLIDEKADIVIVPDGTAIIDDDVNLDEMTVKRYGTKLYITGDLKVLEECDILDELKYLNVRGDAEVIDSLKNRLMAVLTEIEGDVKVVKAPKGRQIGDKMKLKISKWLLDQEPDGLYITDCMQVVLDPDIPSEMILEKLQISNCAKVACSEAQESAVTAIAKNVAKIGKDAEDEDKMSMGGMFGALKELADTRMINAESYVM